MADINPPRQGPDASPLPPSPARLAHTQRTKLRWAGILAGILIAAIAIVVLKRQPQAAAETKASSAGKGGSFPVPVVAGTVARKDVPIYLDGLGTVQAFNTVTVRARVDGQLQKLAFVEGQEVH